MSYNLCHVVLLALCLVICAIECHVEAHSENRNWPLNSSKIIKSVGSDAAAFEALFQVQIRHRFLFEDSFTCSGALVSKMTVVTAAHCTNRALCTAIGSYLGKHVLRVRYGTHSLTDLSHNEMLMQNVFVHPQYDSITGENDIAVIRLARAVVPSANVQLVELQQSPNLPTASKLRLYGWIHSQGSSPERLVERLQVALMKTLSEEECRAEQVMAQMTPSETRICAMGRDGDGCIVDSGAPLVFEDGRLAGIVSMSSTRSCPLGIYTKVASYLDFVKQFIK